MVLITHNDVCLFCFFDLVETTKKHIFWYVTTAGIRGRFFYITNLIYRRRIGNFKPVISIHAIIVARNDVDVRIGMHDAFHGKMCHHIFRSWYYSRYFNVILFWTCIHTRRNVSIDCYHQRRRHSKLYLYVYSIINNLRWLLLIIYNYEEPRVSGI